MKPAAAAEPAPQPAAEVIESKPIGPLGYTMKAAHLFDLTLPAGTKLYAALATPAAEGMYVADAKHPNCPYCGGSGHADDVTPQELDALRRRFVAALATPAAAVETSDIEILDLADNFKSQYTHGGQTYDEYDHIGFARAILALRTGDKP
jgi:hypothetical protein